MTIKHFHEGELLLQNQAGMREKIDVLTQHLMRDFMPDQHREFFEGLEYIFLGTVDHSGLPHATILTGPKGFAFSTEPQTLVIQTGDRRGKVSFEALEVGQPVGVLGLDLANRRRNRMHGRIADFDSVSITISVVQSYGNCPKYITIREVAEGDLVSQQGEIVEDTVLDKVAMGIVFAADTFFIASYVSDGSDAPYEGVDVNHRGGHPGFVSIDSPTQITIPDYKGNYLFNTFGNLLLNPSAGLLFVDFETGDQLHIHGTAEVIEDAETVGKYLGAQRLLRIHIDRAQYQAAATSMRWNYIEASPFNPQISEIKGLVV